MLEGGQPSCIKHWTIQWNESVANLHWPTQTQGSVIHVLSQPALPLYPLQLTLLFWKWQVTVIYLDWFAYEGCGMSALCTDTLANSW